MFTSVYVTRVSWGNKRRPRLEYRMLSSEVEPHVVHVCVSLTVIARSYTSQQPCTSVTLLALLHVIIDR